MVPQNGIEPLIADYKAAVMPFNYKGNMVIPARLELATNGLEIRCSIQLSYGTIKS